jgi:hypothetical protein
MSRAVGADEAGAVDREAHGQVLDRHVVHDLVVGALEEGRIDRAERAHALRGEAGGEGHRVLLGDADVERALGVRLGELVDPGAARHRRGDRADQRVGFGKPGERFAKHVLVGGRARGAFGLLAGDDVELLHPVVLVGAVLGRDVALALLGNDVDQTRALGGVAHVLEHRDQLVEVVAVDRADVVEAQFLEQRAAHRHAAGIFVGLARSAVERLGQLAGDAPGYLAQAEEFGRRDETGKIAGEAADRGCDRHVVVVEDDDQAVSRGLGVVHRLVGHAGAHRPVTDHRDRLARRAGELVGHSEA